MYGLSELLPGQLTVDTIINSDGNSYWKALKNQFKIGDKDKGLDWNVSEENALSIFGNINVRDMAILSGWRFTNEDIRSQNDYFVLKPTGTMSFLSQMNGKELGWISNSGAGLGIVSRTPENVDDYRKGQVAEFDYNGVRFTTEKVSMRIYKAPIYGEVIEFTEPNSGASFRIYLSGTSAPMVVDMDGGTRGLRVNMRKLPTSPDGLPAGSGAIWNDNGTLSIV